MVKLISQDRVAAADGWFYHIRQVEPMCLPMWAHWRHVANMIELYFLRPNRVHNRNGKSIGLAVFAQLMARVSLGALAPHGKYIEIVHIGASWRIRLNLCFLCLPPKSRTQTTSVSSCFHKVRSTRQFLVTNACSANKTYIKNI